MPIYVGSASLSELRGSITTPGRIVQIVHTTWSSALNTTSTSPVIFFNSNPITLSNPSNKILIEFHSDNRCNDWGDGTWNLYYMDLVHIQTGTQITYSGYRGENTNSIRHFHKQAIHAPGNPGPHNYQLRGWSYAALNTTFNGGASQVDNDGIAYIKLMEVAV